MAKWSPNNNNGSVGVKQLPFISFILFGSWFESRMDLETYMNLSVYILFHVFECMFPP